MAFKKGETPQGAKPFKKGQSGNLKGRPQKLPELDKLLAEILGEDKEGISAAKAILMALRAKAAKGDIRAAELLLDRAYGKAKQHIQQDTNLSGALNISVMNPNDIEGIKKLEND
jgi:hypothetical protein